MLDFLDLPLEIRLQIYGGLEIPQVEPIVLGKHFAAEAAYCYPSHILHISHLVRQEALLAFSATSQRPWKINVIASTDTKLCLPVLLPDDLARSAHIQFNFEFPRHRDSPAATAHVAFGMYALNHQRRALLFLAVHQVGCGIDEICRRLAEVPVKRDLEICWSDHDEVTEWETKKTVLQPFSRLSTTLCTFHLGKVSVVEDGSKQELASYLEVVTSRMPK